MTTTLPWNLTVHFHASSFPKDKLLRFDTEDSFQGHFFNSMKQAMYVYLGSTDAIMSMSKADQNSLWNAARSTNRNDFVQICDAFDEKDHQHVPVRIVSNDAPTKLIRANAKGTVHDLIRLVQNETTMSSKAAATTTEEEEEEAIGKDDSRIEIVVQGFVLDLHRFGTFDMSTFFRIFRHADNFLYLIRR